MPTAQGTLLSRATGPCQITSTAGTLRARLFHLGTKEGWKHGLDTRECLKEIRFCGEPADATVVVEDILPLPNHNTTFALGERVAELDVPPTRAAPWYVERGHKIYQHVTGVDLLKISKLDRFATLRTAAKASH